MTQNKYCVYVHRKQTDGSVFYVGKGTPKRARSMRGRSAYWTRIAEKYGRVVDFVCSGMAEDDAFELERFLIAEIGRENLCNLTDGGEGVSGLKMTQKNKDRLSSLFKGIPPSDKTKKAAILKNSKPVGTICGLRFDSCADAARELAPDGLRAAYKASISLCLRGVIDQCYGYKFRLLGPNGELVCNGYRKSISHLKPVGNDYGICFISSAKASEWLGSKSSAANITQMCRGAGRSQKIGGYKWGYLIDGFPYFCVPKPKNKSKPLVNSCGMRFNTQLEALEWLRSTGAPKCRQGSFSSALKKDIKKYKGYYWAFESEEG